MGNIKFEVIVINSQIFLTKYQPCGTRKHLVNT